MGYAMSQPVQPGNKQPAQHVAAQAATEDIVLIIHGIFSTGKGSGILSKALEEAGIRTKVLRYPPVYLLRFWMPYPLRFVLPGWSTRDYALNALLHDIVDYTASGQYRVSIIAHSFGSWLVAKILQQNHTLKLHRVVFLGCIVHELFPWHDIIGRNVQPNCILNDYGTLDVWPVWANFVTWGYGPTGTFGFGRANIIDRDNLAKHSDLVNAEHAKNYIAPFLRDGTVLDPIQPEMGWLKRSCNRCRSWFIGFINLLYFLKWLALAAIILGPIIWLSIYGSPFMRRPPESAASAPKQLSPEWQRWDTINGTTKLGDGPIRTLEVRLGKWKKYLARGAMGEQVPGEAPTVGIAWFEEPIYPNDLQSFTYVFDPTNRDVKVKEAYAFLVSTEDPTTIAPVYRQLRTDSQFQEIEVRNYRGGERLFCVVIVGSESGKGELANPTSWGINLRKK